MYQVNSPLNLSDCCYQVNQGKWFLAGSAFGIPLDMSAVENTLFDQFLQSANGFYGKSMTSLFPCNTMGNHNAKPSSHLVILQNAPPGDIVCPATIDRNILQSLGLNRNVFNQHPYSVLEFFNERFYPCENTSARLCYSSEKLRTAAPFPNIIEHYTEDKRQTDTTPVMSSLYTSPQFYELIAEVIASVRKMNLNKLHIVQELGLDKDMLQELLEDLIGIAQAYSRERTFYEMEE